MTSAQQKVLITGGAGFIGANFAHYWMENHPQDKVIVLDALTYAGSKTNLTKLFDLPNFVFIEGNITDRELVDKLVADVDIVVHFAAESHVDRSILGPQVFVQTNVVGTQSMLDAAIKHKVKRFHHISTDEVFGTLPHSPEAKFNEHTPYDPRSPYSASKASSDHLVRAYGTTFGLPFTITNCSNNYGEFHHPEKLIPLAITNLLEDKSVPIYGSGTQIRDWLYVQDHCRAIAMILENSPVGETYLVGGLTKDITNLEIVETICELLNKPKSMIEHVADRKGHDERYAVDWQKIKTKLNWQPEVTIEEGLLRTVTWYKQNRHWWEPIKAASSQFFTDNYAKR